MTGAEFKRWRKQAGHTQESLAFALGRHRRTIQSWEVSDEVPLIAILACCALVCGYGAQDLRAS